MSKVKLKKKQKNLEFQEIYGFHSVSAALQNTKRKHFGLFIIEKYKDAHEGEKLAIFSANSMLEIAQNKGRATDLLGLKLHDYIRIEFK